MQNGLFQDFTVVVFNGQEEELLQSLNRETSSSSTWIIQDSPSAEATLVNVTHSALGMTSKVFLYDIESKRLREAYRACKYCRLRFNPVASWYVIYLMYGFTWNSRKIDFFSVGRCI